MMLRIAYLSCLRNALKICVLVWTLADCFAHKVLQAMGRIDYKMFIGMACLLKNLLQGWKT